MKVVEMTMPPMGESIFECTVLNWLVKEGDYVTEDDMIIEVATDKIDTEIGSSMSGKITKFLVSEGEVATIGNAICLIEVAGSENGHEGSSKPEKEVSVENLSVIENSKQIEEQVNIITSSVKTADAAVANNSPRFYSPLVLNIANVES
ncbi:MAG: 2-oxo acid dehydrogenase subunit E2, partial [Spirosomaceae bacterium]|nr:2-oxo acid dehydrogenase subunit E2 [Spirosomataceae bacterium]